MQRNEVVAVCGSEEQQKKNHSLNNIFMKSELWKLSTDDFL